ncbi:multidrug efflux RND transporter permease subunit [Arenimonas maotaiensis]|uniref:Efflux pump membrane transporter n=1 Tax=Arenimonas maotaiensis TaxID=1446479 RepID=A0A917FNT5_9GAMM|nr:efflux RND transporter permease subunit [Arenimonas maotaiensis]GGF96284.1 multidrug efflux RND transporter permease subunit [Arenimonas maotaiensis]
MARFFIDRPIFAWVIAIIIMLAGALALTRLPISRYPQIAPPTVSINAVYPGASAQAVENSVTQIIEQSMTGLDGLDYMSSTSDSNGAVGITLTFKTGTDPDTAQVQVQNKLQAATPLLPAVVQQQGISVNKASTGFLQVLGFVSEDGSMDRNDISDYVSSTIVEPLSRVPGVGGVQVFGGKYAMRIWLNPDKLAAYKLAPAEVIAAIQAQNAQIAVGQLGGTPAIDGQQINATITVQDRLQTPEQFRDIVVRANADGSALKLGDVARVELGSESYSVISRYNGQPASGVAVSLATNANALQTSDAVAALMEQMKPSFPKGLKVVVPFDTTPFVRVSINEVLKTLLEAVVLVFLVIFLFLQNFRATLIPTIAVPVVLLGTLGILLALGFSINMLTMFAMVLAIGLLVDDAIVVVENVERLMSEEGLSPLEATRKSMDQITGALVGIGLVLAAVFVPMAFLTGSTGVIYRQFTATIVSAMALSVLVAIVLTPALCATLLKPLKKGEHHGEKGFFKWFNAKFDSGNARYQGTVRRMLARSGRFLLVYAALAGAMALLYARVPSSFLPDEDQGVLFTIVQTPVGATQQRTQKVMEQVESHYLKNESTHIESTFAVQGFSFAGSGQNNGMVFVKLKDWEERTSADASVNAMAGRAMGAFSQIKDAMVFAIAPPPVTELGTTGGFNLYLKDSNNQGHDALMAARNQLLGAAAQSKLLQGVRPNGQEDTPQFRLDIDTEKAAALGVTVDAINSALSVAWGGRYIDDFIDRGRVKRVYVQSDAEYRMVPEDFQRWSVRNKAGDMVPVSSFSSQRWEYGSPRLERYNGVPAVNVTGQAAPGVSSGDAMAEMERLAAQLPPGFTLEWSGQSYQERVANAQTPMLYALSLLVVFLCLAALYESWSIPSSVLMVVPLGILGTVLFTWLRGLERDVYFQVGMLTTVGLSSKNAVLIIEFAKSNLEKGMGLVEGTVAAIRDRLRPILMTSIAFGFGVLPLALATGAGSGAQRAIGTGVIGGMLAGTFLGIFFIPLFFVSVRRLIDRLSSARGGQGADSHD